jgi:soluble lytic murein transglycosylase-like protein
MKRIVIALCVMTGILFVCRLLPAQQSAQHHEATPAASDQYVELLRKDLRSEKKQIVAANMLLTEAEAQKFWPVYDEYTAEAAKVNDAKLSVIKEYVQNYESLNDVQAERLVKNWSAADQATVQLRLKYLPIFQKALPGKKVARFFQVDRRIGSIIDLQLASEIPLVEP